MRSSWSAIKYAQKYGMVFPKIKRKNKKAAKKAAAKKKVSDLRKIAENARRQQLKARALRMRKNPTPAEKVLWSVLKDVPGNGGFQFKCQVVMLNDYIVDFSCGYIRLCIEVDGDYHYTEEQIERDMVRTQRLMHHGWKVIRFKNEEVIKDCAAVRSKITAVCRERKFKR